MKIIFNYIYVNLNGLSQILSRGGTYFGGVKFFGIGQLNLIRGIKNIKGNEYFDNINKNLFNIKMKLS